MSCSCHRDQWTCLVHRHRHTLGCNSECHKTERLKKPHCWATRWTQPEAPLSLVTRWKRECDCLNSLRKSMHACWLNITISHHNSCLAFSLGCVMDFVYVVVSNTFPSSPQLNNYVIMTSQRIFEDIRTEQWLSLILTPCSQWEPGDEANTDHI